MKQSIRQAVYQKCNGRCGYCGKEIEYKAMQVDHIEAHWHNLTDKEAVRAGIKKGSNDIDNLMPACARCNRWKSTYSIEQFRKEIALQVSRLNLYNANYRIAIDYGLITENDKPVQFYFETLNK